MPCVAVTFPHTGTFPSFINLCTFLFSTKDSSSVVKVDLRAEGAHQCLVFTSQPAGGESHLLSLSSEDDWSQLSPGRARYKWDLKADDLYLVF